jgi:hypothetical protein
VVIGIPGYPNQVGTNNTFFVSILVCVVIIYCIQSGKSRKGCSKRGSLLYLFAPIDIEKSGMKTPFDPNRF